MNLFTDLFDSKRTFITSAQSETNWTFREFWHSSTRIAQGLYEAGVKRGSRIALVCDNSEIPLMVYIAAARLGTLVCPIDTLKGPSEISEILEVFNPHLLLVQDSNRFSNIPVQQINVTALQDWAKNFTEPKQKDVIDLNEPFLVTFTSGSTGQPKGVVHSFGNLILSARAFAARFGFSEKNIFVHNLPMSYMAGILNQFILPLVSGSSIVILPRFSVSNLGHFWSLATSHNANTFWIVPTIASLLLKLDRSNLGEDYCRTNNVTFCIGTAPLALPLRREFEARYKVVLNESYGLSETLFVSTNSPLDEIVDNSVGRPLDGTEVNFASDGEIMIRVPWNFLGYFGASAAPIPFPSGDNGQLNSNGLLFITGRKKDIIIRGGINISPRKAEDYLGSTGAFDEIVIIGVPDPILGEKTVCFFTPRSDIKLIPAEMNKSIQSVLGQHYLIDKFINVEAMPKNLNGKIDKNTLRERVAT
jgi:long-chain acyl-CoA synthetase